MMKFDAQAYARALKRNGYIAGFTTTDSRVFVWYNGYIWQVMGGDERHPSLKLEKSPPMNIIWIKR